ncbi:hypothetical protein O2W15_11655 [Modestobacter sp. VKM Ac-2979]|uniref:hypothetical protein n=1 Tax=unclassified Modestobacter TaxID=2643866 RepID=UPI0022AB7DD3|nr:MULTISPECIES: hypothetical protein [unclassified Modestobacter]MCZ2812090.1 hypothetical protein [Modestobacter sp. VKM Ac-2979]MCZ2843814.1 hypothetical protein [Modestobacter sp. VKM Ac-2980]
MSRRRSDGRITPVLRGAIVAAVGTGILGARLLHARRNWGATADEVRSTLPGDDFVPEPAEQTTLAVSIDAPAERIWAWLVQIGQDRGGMYSYDVLENLVGLDIHSAEEIRDEWQHLAVGDHVVVVPEGFGPMPDGYSFTVALADPGRALVLRQSPPEHPWNGVWSFHVVPRRDGGCRLLSRMRTEVQPQRGLRIATRVLEPVTLVMTRRMLQGIKERAERPAVAPTASREMAP